MVEPNCVRCGHTVFDVFNSGLDSELRYVDFVHCVKCGGVVSAISVDVSTKHFIDQTLKELNIKTKTKQRQKPKITLRGMKGLESGKAKAKENAKKPTPKRPGPS
jgi:hypothetical protein